jgi:hypothetical protein
VPKVTFRQVEKLEEKEQRLEHLLLGRLPEEEQEALETRALEDPKFFEQLLLAEDELVDARVGGELSAEDGQRFDDRLGRSPRVRQRLEIAQLIAEEVSSEPAEAVKTRRWGELAAFRPFHRRRFFVPLLTAAALSLAIALPVLRNLLSSGEQGTLERSVEPLVLRPSGQRSPSSPRPWLVRPENVENGRLSLYLELEEGASSLHYRVEVIDSSGEVVWRGEGLSVRALSRRGKAVACNPPMEVLLAKETSVSEVHFYLYGSSLGVAGGVESGAESGAESETLLSIYSLPFEFEVP